MIRIGPRTTLLAAAVALGCLLSPIGTAHAAEHSFKPIKRERGMLLFRLRGLQPTEIRAAYLHARNYRRPLRTGLVRKKAVHGLLRVRVPRSAKRVSLVVLTYPGPAPSPAPLGKNGCSGVVLTQASDLQVAIDAWPNGTTFCLQAGTYYLRNSIQTHSYDRFIGQAGVIFDGQGTVNTGLWGYGGTAGEVHVTVENMIFQHFTGIAVQLGWYSYVGHNEMRENQIGTKIDSYSRLDDNYIHDNYQYGITGGPGHEMLIENNELDHNNTEEFCGGACKGDAGGSKIVGSTTGEYDLVWRNNYVHDNIGVGIWSDINVRTALYENNTVVNNSQSGILHEISWDAVIRNNTLMDNDASAAGKSCGDGAQIQISDSTNVETYGNTVIAGNGANGICAYAAKRPGGAPNSQDVAGLYVHDNTVYMRDGATTGLAGHLSAGEAEAENRFVNNAYFVADTSQKYWVWPEKSRDWQAWQATGQDPTGALYPWP